MFDRRIGEKEHQILEVQVDEEGNLVFEGYDIGEIVKEYWGDSDYENWLTIKSEKLPDMLLHLIHECFERQIFKNLSEFRSWLEKKGITGQFQSWI